MSLTAYEIWSRNLKVPMPPAIGYDDYGIILQHDDKGKFYAHFENGKYVYPVRQVNS